VISQLGAYIQGAVLTGLRDLFPQLRNAVEQWNLTAQSLGAKIAQVFETDGDIKIADPRKGNGHPDTRFQGPKEAIPGISIHGVGRIVFTFLFATRKVAQTTK